MGENRSSQRSGFDLDLSVLIVTYNSKDTIAACVSDLMQALKSLTAEVIIVDNHSTDGTREELELLKDQHESLHIQLNRSNRGFAAGNNQALDMARGKDILILNPDTRPERDSIAGLLSELRSNPEWAVVAPQLHYPDGRIQKTCRRFPRYRDVIFHSLGLAQAFPENQLFNGWKMGDFDHRSRRQVDQPAGAALLVRGPVLRDLQGFDLSFPMFFNDVDLCRRIKDAGHQIWYLPEYKIAHVGGASVKQARLKMMLSSHISFFRYFEKHATRLHQQPMNFFIAILLYLSLIPRMLALLVMKPGDGSSRDTL